ncbi:hypothetical protein [Mucilaginibacter sp. KACC 22063]|uniref:hypothetical protein n=1 Tax=Mucilaginibacter sp. KACC 22063 TaxID=3025666 RepID=UPI00236732C3|nr:hypothetical protein [Mucilaginibacter sp. KACC 22063]WDF55563.1 hypothetical protein PQ461_00635 [Mucilaginibacter sp. KACC 22063]
MNGTLAQLIAIVSYGNEYLVNDNLASDFYDTNSTFQFCNRVQFWDTVLKKSFFKKSVEPGVVAGDPVKWFENLKQDGFKKLKLVYKPSDDQSFAKDYKLAGFVGGGGKWFIEAINSNNSSTFWESDWQVTNQNASDRKIWTVNYLNRFTAESTGDIKDDVAEIQQTLKKVLSDIAEFAYKNELTNWGDWFTKAYDALNAGEPEKDFYHTDIIINKNYSLQARQVFFSSAKAWVFGGMGSWNDLGFSKPEDQTKYETLSDLLYQTIIRSIVAVFG